MKTIFNNKRNFTFYCLFAASILSFAALLLFAILFNVSISPLVFISLMGIVFFGGIIIQMRNDLPGRHLCAVFASMALIGQIDGLRRPTEQVTLFRFLRDRKDLFYA